MKPNETPFKPAWWGLGLERVGLGRFRPDQGTYGEYDYETLPPLPCVLDGSYAWLREYEEVDGHIAEERAEENVPAVAALKQAAHRDGVHLPDELVTFLDDASLAGRIRSATDCFLDVCAAPVRAPDGAGSLVRFLADSQGCLFWYVYVPDERQAHCVVVSTWFHGLPDEEWQDEPPDPADMRFCAESIESFLCRFVIENEIAFASYEQEPLGRLEREYVRRYAAGG